MSSKPQHAPSASDGGMDLTHHMATWLGFWAAAKWTTVAAVALAIFLAIFRTHN